MKFPIKFIIALCALVIGITGILICVLPHYGAQKVVYDFIKATEKGDTEAMLNCTALSQMSSQLSSSVNSELLSATDPADPDALIRSMLSLPSEVDVTGVTVLGCTAEETVELSAPGYRVTALIQATYIDGEGEEQTDIVSRNYHIAKIGNDYKIYG